MPKKEKNVQDTEVTQDMNVTTETVTQDAVGETVMQNTAGETTTPETEKVIPKTVPRVQAALQLNEFTYWDHILSLVPLEDKRLRRDIARMVLRSNSFTMDMPEPDGEFEVTNWRGKKVTVDGEKVLSGDHDILRQIPVGDPKYQKLLDSKLKLLDRIQQKYHGEGHEALEQEVGILRCKTENLKQGIGYEVSPGMSIVSGSNGLQKFQDVLFDMESSDMKGNDRMQWNFKDPAAVEQSMKDFGLTDIQRKFKEINEHNAEWAKEWFHGDRNPEKLREIGEKLKQDVKDLDTYIPNFEQKYRDDLKLPADQRKIFNITAPDDIDKNDLIIDEGKGGRGINGKNWEIHKELFAEELERQLITAELQDLPKKHKIDPLLMNKVKAYITLTDEALNNDIKQTYDGNAFNTPAITGIRRLMDIKAEVEKNPDLDGAQELLEIADKHLNDPENAALVEKANKINQEHAAMHDKVAALSNEAVKDGLINGNRLRGLYEEKNLGGTGELRFFRSTVAAMQYFNHDSDEVVLNSMRTLMNDPEEASPETKQKMARELEKFFRSVMNFDNEKCEYGSLQELWTDPKHKDLHIMANICMESESLVKQYAALLKDPTVDCALNEKQFKEVKSKLALLEMEATVAGSTGDVSRMYSDPGMADYNIDRILKTDVEVAAQMSHKTKETGMITLANINGNALLSIKPKEKYLRAINRERENLGLSPFPDEDEMADAYYDVMQAFDKAVARDLQKSEELSAQETIEEPVKEEKPVEMKQEEPQKEEIKQEEPQKEEIKQEEPQKEEIKQEEPKKEEPQKEEPQVAAPKQKKDSYKAWHPAGDQPYDLKDGIKAIYKETNNKALFASDMNLSVSCLMKDNLMDQKFNVKDWLKDSDQLEEFLSEPMYIRPDKQQMTRYEYIQSIKQKTAGTDKPLFQHFDEQLVSFCEHFDIQLDLEKVKSASAIAKQEEPKKEEIKQEEPKKEEPKKEEIKQEEPKKEEPKKEEIKQEEPKKEEAQKEEPVQQRKRRNSFSGHDTDVLHTDLEQDYDRMHRELERRVRKYEQIKEEREAPEGWVVIPESKESEAVNAVREVEKASRINTKVPYIKMQEIQHGLERGEFLDTLAKVEEGLNARHRFDVGRVFSGDSKDMQPLKKAIANYKEYIKDPFAPKFGNVTEKDLLENITDKAMDYQYAKTHDPKTKKPMMPDSKMGKARLKAADDLITFVRRRWDEVDEFEKQFKEKFEAKYEKEDDIEAGIQLIHDGFLFEPDADDIAAQIKYNNAQAAAAEQEDIPKLSDQLESDIHDLQHGSNGDLARKNALKQVIVRKALIDEFGKDALADDNAYADKFMEFTKNGVFDKIDKLPNEFVAQEARVRPLEYYKSLNLGIKAHEGRFRTVDETGSRLNMSDLTTEGKAIKQQKFMEKKAAFAGKAAEAFLHEFYQEAKKEIMESKELSEEEKKQRIKQNPRRKYIEENKAAYMKDQNFVNFMDSIKDQNALNVLQEKTGKQLFDYYKSGVYLKQPEKQQEQPVVEQNQPAPEKKEQAPEQRESVQNFLYDEKVNQEPEFGEHAYLNTFLANAEKNGWNAPEDKEFLTQLYIRALNENLTADQSDMSRLAHRIEAKPLDPATAAETKSKYAHSAYNALRKVTDSTLDQDRIEATNSIAQAAASYKSKVKKAAEPVNVNEVRAEAQAKLNDSFEKNKQYPDKNVAVQEYAVIAAAVPVQSKQNKGELTGLSKDDFNVQVNALKKTAPFKTMISGGSDKTLFEKATRDKGQDLYAELGRSKSVSQKQQQQKKQQPEKVKNLDDPKKGGIKI